VAQPSAIGIGLAGGMAALIAPWLAALGAAAVARGRYRRAAAVSTAGLSERGSHARAGTRVVRGSLRAGPALGAMLFALSLVPIAASLPSAVGYVRAWWPLVLAGALSCLAGGTAAVAAWRGAFAAPAAGDPAYAAVATYVHVRQDAREEAAARRRRAAAARREAARHRDLAYRLDAMHDMDGEEFEQLCGDYFAALGYTVDLTPQSGDGGIDLVLTSNGVLAVAQCKRTRKSVGEPVVRDLFGAMHHTGADEAFLCASSGFSAAAERWAAGKPLTLVRGDEIVSTLRRRR
jgi:hypothetical protein